MGLTNHREHSTKKINKKEIKKKDNLKHGKTNSATKCYYLLIKIGITNLGSKTSSLYFFVF